MTRRLLYQFPLSLYCEKTRWNLDWKGLPWQAVNLLPGPHMLTAWRLAGNPAAYLVGDGFTLADLTAAAMLGPLVGPPESPWGDDKVPAGDGGERQRLRVTTAGQWVLRLYREHRAPHIAGPPPA